MSLWTRAIAWLDLAHAADEVERRNARTIQVFCLGLGALLLASSIPELVTLASGRAAAGATFGLLANLASVAVCGWSFAAARTGRFAASCKALVVAFIGILASSLAVRGLAYHETLYVRVYAVLLVIPALVLGRRALWWSFASLMAGLLLGYLHDTVWASPLPPLVPSLGPWFQAIAVSLLFCVLVDRFGMALREAYSTALSRQAELEKAVDRLREEAQRRNRAEAMLREAQKMEALGRLSGSVAHDFANILQVVGGFAGVAGSKLPVDDPVQVDLEEIRDGVNRGVDLTRQLLTFARRQAAEPKVIVVHDRLKGLFPILTRLAGESVRLDLRVETSDGAVRMDPSHLEQVMLNLVANARDAMPRGGSLSIDAWKTADDAGEWIDISVRDEGVGMDDSTLARAFEPFFTTKPPDKGTGLGLATSHGVVSQAGGTIHIESALGRGTTVHVRLPRLPLEAQAPAHS